jgi:ketosteroid isomerase-like protein
MPPSNVDVVRAVVTEFNRGNFAAAIPAEELTDLGNGVVLLIGTARFKGRASGLDVEAAAANLWTVRDGKVSRFRFYQTKEDALADAATS